jgi:hypothetical protein
MGGSQITPIIKSHFNFAVAIEHLKHAADESD